MDKQFIIKLLESTKNIMAENQDYLIDLDSIVGDGDLGLTMSDGFAAAFSAVSDTSETDLGKILYLAGKAMASAVPSTMGTLMASGLMSAGKALRGTSEIDLKGIANLYAAYMEGVASRGKAKTGEKTFLDGIDPAIRSLQQSQEQTLPFIRPLRMPIRRLNPVLWPQKRCWRYTAVPPHAVRPPELWKIPAPP